MSTYSPLALTRDTPPALGDLSLSIYHSFLAYHSVKSRSAAHVGSTGFFYNLEFLVLRAH